jgi:ABC-type antimicrobial peptide transport system permease subunit
MRIRTLVARNLSYFWKTNLAVVLGVATAVAVLAGALMVGDSVRASLREIFLARLGRTDDVISSTSFFTERLADQLSSRSQFAAEFGDHCSLLALQGLVIHEPSGRRASNVQVYGVDDGFWRFHRVNPAALGSRELIPSPDLVSELGTKPGDTILLRIEKPSAIPAGSLHGRKEDLSRTIRLTAREPLDRSSLSEFSLRPQQGPMLAVFVPLSRLQTDLELSAKVNTILLSENEKGSVRSGEARSAIEAAVRETFSLDDLGIKLRVLDKERGIALEDERAVISESLYSSARRAAEQTGVWVNPILSYLANAIRDREREVPYSLVTAIDDEAFEVMSHDYGHGLGPAPQEQNNRDSALPRIVLNEWAAQDLNAHRGDVITLDYYLWQEEGRLRTESARFRLDAIVPINGKFADRDLVPDYPGITQTESISDWDPPFPVDLTKVRPADEDYWRKYRTTPKAFISLDTGVGLWHSRYGNFTSLRIGDSNRSPEMYLDQFKSALKGSIDPFASGFVAYPVRSEGIAAAQGATDFGEYFVYFSFFIVIAALLLAMLFFKLGVEQRSREIGLLGAIGFPAGQIRTIFLVEGVVLSVAASVLGIVGAIGYGVLMMYGLRTWWVGAVGTTALSLNVSAVSLAMGAAGGIVVAPLCILWTLRGLSRAAPRDLLAGSTEPVTARVRSPRRRHVFSSAALAVVLLVIGLLLVAAALAGWVGQTTGFFAGGSALLAGMLCAEYWWLRRKRAGLIAGSGWWPVSRLGLRYATYRPGRSILCVSLIACSAFIIFAVGSFKRGEAASDDKRAGTGGYPLIAESLLPLYHDPNTGEGREALSLVAQKGFDPARVFFTRFRVRKGDDASCLNLYQPRDPRILAPESGFVEQSRFAFQSSLAATASEKQNPWLLLNTEFEDGAVPVIADANSLTYVLHKNIGEDTVINGGPAGQIKLRIVGALADSIFQSELLMSEKNFLRLFPEQGGYNFFLLELSGQTPAEATAGLEEQLSDFGFDVSTTAERQAAFHRVENTYISTFQALGGLGLVLGTIGLGAVLMRNVLERMREMALLRAVGYSGRQLAWMIIAENGLFVVSGLSIGACCALVGILPALWSRGGQAPGLSVSLLILVAVTGMTASVVAAFTSLRAPLIESLRAE